MLNPEIGQYVDVLFVHLLPYWENSDIRGALRGTNVWYDDVQKEFPGKPIVIGEAGWPSEGRTRGRAEASIANEAQFVRGFVQFAMDKGWDYYLLEAYDQPLKRRDTEGAVGAYWGLFDAAGHPKFSFTGLLRNFPEWRGYALAVAFLVLALGLLVLGRMPRLRQTGYMVMGGLIALVSTGLLALIDATALEYIDPTNIAAMIAMSPLVLLACAIIITEARNGGQPVADGPSRRYRRNSHEEPACLHPCADLQRAAPDGDRDAERAFRLDYDNYEVIVLDNKYGRSRSLEAGGNALPRARRLRRRAAFPFFSISTASRASRLER
jgi:hypothetical protein